MVTLICPGQALHLGRRGQRLPAHAASCALDPRILSYLGPDDLWGPRTEISLSPVGILVVQAIDEIPRDLSASGNHSLHRALRFSSKPVIPTQHRQRAVPLRMATQQRIHRMPIHRLREGETLPELAAHCP